MSDSRSSVSLEETDGCAVEYVGLDVAGGDHDGPSTKLKKKIKLILELRFPAVLRY
jgi:hypothetical protein